MNIEKYSNFLGGYTTKTSDARSSRSFLNSPNNNLYNSIYCPSLVPNTKGFITKKNMKFSGDLKNLHESTFTGTSPMNNESGCLTECRRNKYCAAYEFDKTNKNCNLFNNFPNSYSPHSNNNIGYKVNSGYDFNNLNNDQKNNVWKKCGSQWISGKYNIKENDIDKCLKPIFRSSKLRGYNADPKCLYNTLGPSNDHLKSEVFNQNYIEDPEIVKSVPNSDIDTAIKNFYSKVNNNVVFSNLNNKEIIEDRDNNITFDSSLLNNVNSYYDIGQNSEDLKKIKDSANQIRERVGLNEGFQNNNNKIIYTNLFYVFIILIIMLILINLFK